MKIVGTLCIEVAIDAPDERGVNILAAALGDALVAYASGPELAITMVSKSVQVRAEPADPFVSFSDGNSSNELLREMWSELKDRLPPKRGEEPWEGGE